MSKTYAIIAVYNGIHRNWIKECFDSILGSSVDVEIIAIDNGSTDGSAELIKKKYPQVALIEAGENLGFGKANNLGMKRAVELGAEYVFLLNQDARVEPDTVEHLIEQAGDNLGYGIISPIHLDGTGTAMDKNFATYLVPPLCPGFYSDAVLGNLQDKLYPVSFVNAAAWLITSECLRKVGGFSPLFFHYGEDDNYCQRVIYKGLKIGVYPRAFVCHDRQMSTIRTSVEESNRRKLVGLLVKASNPNNPSYLARRLLVENCLMTLINSGSLSECLRRLKFYRKHKKHIASTFELSVSSREFVFIK